MTEPLLFRHNRDSMWAEGCGRAPLQELRELSRVFGVDAGGSGLQVRLRVFLAGMAVLHGKERAKQILGAWTPEQRRVLHTMLDRPLPDADLDLAVSRASRTSLRDMRAVAEAGGGVVHALHVEMVSHFLNAVCSTLYRQQIRELLRGHHTGPRNPYAYSPKKICLRD